MATFLLWNVNKKPLDGFVQDLVREYTIDVVLLVEFAVKESHLADLLLVDGLSEHYSSTRFGVFVRGTHQFQRLSYRLGRRVLMWQWVPPSGQSGLVVFLHGLDRRNYDDSTQRVFFRRVADAVRRREKVQGHQRSLIAGDFNAQPFESAIVASDGLHAIGVRTIGKNVARKIREGGAGTDFFYNPMWRAYGQPPLGEAGSATYYWMGNRGQEFVWHMLDQVVIRPLESARFPEDQLRIITKIGGIELLDAEGLPDSQTASDHLPIMFHWNL